MPLKFDNEIPASGEKRYGGERPSKDLQKVMRAQERTELAEVEQREAPPIIVESRCSICMSPYRNFIDALLVKGHSYVSIAERVPGKNGRKFDRRSVSNHAKKHLSYQDAAIRAVLEEEAEQARQNYEEGVKGAITTRGVLETLLRKGYEDAINNVSSVEPKDLIAIAQTIEKMNQQTESAQVEYLRAQSTAFIEAIRKVVPREYWEEIYREARKLMGEEKVEALEQTTEVVDATVVE